MFRYDTTMTLSRRVAFVHLLAILLTACAQVAYRPEQQPAPAPTIEPMPVPSKPIAPMPKPAPVKPRADVPLKATPPAVAVLMQEAESSRAAGQLDNATASLERAIRIQPRNAQLWQQLASVRLQQGQPSMAEDLAKKSNVLAKGNRAMTQKNWSLIAEARRLKGDAEGAADAEARAAGP